MGFLGVLGGCQMRATIDDSNKPTHLLRHSHQWLRIVARAHHPQAVARTATLDADFFLFAAELQAAAISVPMTRSPILSPSMTVAGVSGSLDR